MWLLLMDGPRKTRLSVLPAPQIWSGFHPCKRSHYFQDDACVSEKNPFF